MPVGSTSPLPVSAETVVGIRIVDRLCGIHEQCTADGRAAVGVGCLRIHSLGVQVDGQVVIEECRRQVDAGRVALVVAGLHHTVLVGIAEAHAVRHVLEAAADGDVMVSADGRAVDFVLPVSVGEQVIAVCIVVAQV